MKFGASVWPFKWTIPYDKSISRIAQLGFTAVELIRVAARGSRRILHPADD